MIPAFKSGFKAVSVAMMQAFPTAFFKSMIFLFKEGPAETTITGTVDGLKPAFLFEHEDLSKVPMVRMTGVSIEPMKLHKGKKFFYYSGSGLENEMLLTDGFFSSFSIFS